MKLDYMIELEGGFRIHGSEELRSGGWSLCRR